MDECLFFGAYIILILTLGLFVSIFRLRKSNLLLESIEQDTDFEFDVQFMRSSASKFKLTGGVYAYGKLLVYNDFFILVPNSNKLYNIVKARFPFIFVKNNKRKNWNNNIEKIIPKIIILNKWNSLNIIQERVGLINLQVYYTITFVNKDHSQNTRDKRFIDYINTFLDKG